MPLALTTVKEKLERRFNFISSIEREADFFLEICNYLDFLISDMRTRYIVMQIIHESNLAHEEYNNLQNESIKKLLEIRQTLQEKISDNKIDEKISEKIFERFDKLYSGEIETSNPTWEALEGNVYTILRKINDDYPEISINQFAMIDSIGNIHLISNYGELLNKCREEKKLIDIKKRTSIWGAWDRLYTIYQSVFLTDKEIQKKYKIDSLTGIGYAMLAEEMRKILNNRYPLSPPKRVYFKKEDYILDFKRLHNYVFDNLDKTNLGFILLNKYKQRIEWYNREKILDITKNKDDKPITRVEIILTRELARYLHDNGVIPLAEVIFGSSRPDLLGLYSGEELFPIEVKVLRYGDLTRLRKGFNQILQYLRTINLREGFYVIFCRGDYTLDISESVFINDQRINIVTIDLYETPPSQRSPNIWRVPQEEFIGK